MKIIILYLFIFTAILFGQKSDINHPYCINITKYVLVNVDSLQDDSLKIFYKQFGLEKNKNAAEFRQWGNEVLFKVLEKNPKQFFENLFKMRPSEIKTIENEINHPIHDGINMIKLYKNIENCDLNKNTKEKAIKFIKPSYEAFKKLIEDWEKKNNKKWPY